MVDQIAKLHSGPPTIISIMHILSFKYEPSNYSFHFQTKKKVLFALLDNGQDENIFVT